MSSSAPSRSRFASAPHPELAEWSGAEMQQRLSSGELSSRELVAAHLERIDAIDRPPDGLRSLISINPDAVADADASDRRRRRGAMRGPLDGIPVVVKDNIDTAEPMGTTAGSVALLDVPVAADAPVVAHLRNSGAVILAKANLSEWANFRAMRSSSGWSAVGGQTRNPHALDRTPCGSSSGSAVAVSAGLSAIGVATETDGSIVCPASVNGVVAIKPTVGLTSRSGVIPVSPSQDTVGPMARTVADAAAALQAMCGADAPAGSQVLTVATAVGNAVASGGPDALAGARIGVARQLWPDHADVSTLGESALAELRDAGAEIVDPVELPSFAEVAGSQAEAFVLLYEFVESIGPYLRTRPGGPQSLAELIEFNRWHADVEMPFFRQERFELAADFGPDDHAAYTAALAECHRLSRTEGIDAALAADDLDAIVAPTGTPAWPIDPINGDAFGGGSSGYPAMAGYPIVTVPMGTAFGLPVGLSFIGTAWSDATLVRLAGGFEAVAGARPVPRYVETIEHPGAWSRADRTIQELRATDPRDVKG